MLIAIGCAFCGDRLASAAAYEIHRPADACLPQDDRSAAGLAERVHRDRSGHGQDGIRYWVIADAEHARRQAEKVSADTDEVKAARRAELFAARARAQS